jgi:hypothetical protein
MSLETKSLGRPASAGPWPASGAVALSAAAREILRRTAQYLALTPGGLRGLGSPTRGACPSLTFQADSRFND